VQSICREIDSTQSHHALVAIAQAIGRSMQDSVIGMAYVHLRGVIAPVLTAA
jgi:hypothetical protein